MRSLRTIVAIATCLCVSLPALAQHNLKKDLATINEIGNSGIGHEEAVEAWKRVAVNGIDNVPRIMLAINKQNTLAANWLRSAADQIIEQHLSSGGSLPTDVFEKIVFDQAYAPRARRMAFEWLKKSDPKADARIVPKMLNDSSLEMRRDAVELAISKAEKLEGKAAVKQYRVALTAARDLDQVETITKQLEDAGEEVDLQKHFGFLPQWKVIGPFDNTAKGGFNVNYGPEQDLASGKTYQGKKGSVAWLGHTTEDDFGVVDLNDVVGKNMGAAAYAYTEFHSSKAQEVELRLQSKNANKIWLNGELVMENEVYHSGGKFDQYIAKVPMQAGMNSILLKICQNEQTDAWAQDWQFQLRVCDELGTAIHAAR